MLAPDPDKIIVPRKHGEILIDPPLGELAREVEKAPPPGLLPSESWRDGQYLEAFRAPARAHLRRAVAQHASAIGQPLDAMGENGKFVITGHQVEFFHAGVWAKMIATDAIARKAGAVSIDLLVDHDIVDEMGFDLPKRAAGGGGAWRKESVTFDDASALPAEFLRAPDAGAFDRWVERVEEFPAGRMGTLEQYFSGLRPVAGERKPYTNWMSQARREFEKQFGINVLHVPATAVCSGPAWDAFVGSWVRNAAAWTAVYNRHLADYRMRHHIKRPQQPMPDLARDEAGGVFELPFWIYQQGEARERLNVHAKVDEAAILFKGERIAVDISKAGGLITRRADGPGLLIRPRALTFTMFVRLFLADVFIHGIGGALYDQITDGIMAELFGENAAASYGCVSAAWLLPLGDGDRGESISTLKSRLHHLEHNPQLAIAPEEAGHSEIAGLLSGRQRLIQKIADSLAADRGQQRGERRGWFQELHAANAQIHQLAPGTRDELDRRMAAAEKTARDEKVLQWREWFFALHSASSLRDLIDKIRGSI